MLPMPRGGVIVFREATSGSSFLFWIIVPR